MEDITELTRLEEELQGFLRQAGECLCRAERERRDKIGVHLHRLSRAANATHGDISYIEMFEEGMLGELSSIQREKIQIIHSQMEQMIKLVEDMLDTSRLESRELKIQKSPLRLEEIARTGSR